MIHGCVKDAPPPRLVPSPVVDLGPMRCPEIDQETKAEAQASTPRPPFDIKDTDGVAAHSATSVRGWISRLEVSERRKNLTLSRTIDLYDRCRGAVAPVKATS